MILSICTYEMNWLSDCCSAEESTAAAAAAAAAQPSRHGSSVQSKQLCLYYVQVVTIVITNCFYRMLQTDMQLSSIYLASELCCSRVEISPLSSWVLCTAAARCILCIFTALFFTH